jgi:hypothetical protein
MIHVNKLAASMAATLTLSTTLSCAHNQSPNQQEMVKNQQEVVKNQQEMVKHFFAQTLKTKLNAELNSKADFARNANHSTDIQQQLKDKDVANTKKMVWAAWCEANRELQEEKLIKPQSLQYGGQGSWNLPQTLEPNAVMPYYYGAKGQTNGQLPLFLYLHGSGPKKQEWQTGLMLGNSFEDGPSLYFIPQIPNEGNYYRWWQLAKQFAWEKLIRQALVDGNVDVNRLYVFGISEGGYGSQRLASFYADYWAAAGPMAGGEPLKNAPVENCANIGFSFLTGAEDTGFYRNILTRYTQEAFDSAQQARPLSADNRPLFQHRINLLERMQHSINYSLTTPWLKDFIRNPYPKTVLWEDFEMDGRHRSGFYNLQVLVRPSEQRTYYEMSIKDNVITMNINDVEYTTIEKDQRWGIEMKFNRSYKQSKGGKLRIYLNEQLVDMSKAVTLIVNGKQLYRGNVKPTLQDMINSCMEYFDPYRIFPASIEVSY